MPGEPRLQVLHLKQRAPAEAVTPEAAGHIRCMDKWEMERAVERGVRRANGEDVPDDDACCSCLAVPGCLLIVGFILFVIVQSGMPWDW
ncbi:hypothetical protein AB0D49_28670 [Streptomyces sp. NPDC048290]|uniref:hypothetical protein n=1 Tax=Streptomyces sp. NPDC048290 TaxID=3155811 RepID=UPI00342AB26A